MAKRTPAAAVEQANLILAANAAVAADAREKFTAWLVADLQTPAAALQASLGSVSGAEGSREAAQTSYANAVNDGDELVRDVNGYLKGLPRKTVNRDAMKAHYGIARGVGGSFTDAQTISLLRGFITANETAPAAAKLRPDLLTDIQATLTVIDTNRPNAATGERQEEIDARNAQWELLEDNISRAWHYLSAALPGGVFDAGLARYGFTPRQKPDAAEEPVAPVNPPA